MSAKFKSQQVNSTQNKISIPIHISNDFVEIYPDELPVGELDYNDLFDVLRSELAPLNVWRTCAVEYHRQGFHFEFETVLNEIVESLADSSVEKIYRERPDYNEGMAQIYDALAAKSLAELGRIRDKSSTKSSEDNEYVTKIVSFLRKADEHMRINEYTWLIKGFFELRQGDLKRAEENFKAVYDRATKGNNSQKKRFLFGSLVGLGAVSYGLQKYSIALDHFSKAIQNHPSCTANIRLALSSCCFKLEQYDRAKAAVEKTFQMDPGNPDSLVMFALLEQVAAQKDKTKRDMHRVNSFEYCTLAAAINPNCAMALNHLANHSFHTWKVIADHTATVLGNNSIQMPRIYAKDLCEGDHIKINRLPISFSVVNIKGSTIDHDELFVVTIDGIFPEDMQGLEKAVVEARELGRVNKLAKDALNMTSVPGIKSESYYIMGRVYYAQMNTNYAFECYKQSLKEWPDMMLSAFGAAEILLSRNDLAASLEIFEKILIKYPDDKETQAYVILVKSLHRKELSPLEKVREVASGFTFEIDLWLLQGQLRHSIPAEYHACLKCYNHAVECMEQRGVSVSPSILSNIAVLHHSLGKLNTALEITKKALIAVETLSVDGSNPNPIFKSADLCDVFYSWSSPLCYLKTGPNVGEFIFTSYDDIEDITNVHEHFKVGDEVLIDSILHIIVSVDESTISTKSPLMNVHYLASNKSNISQHDDLFGDDDDKMEEDNVVVPLSIKIKKIFHNFNDDYTTLAFNYARILEDTGCARAATEVYVGLLKLHPSFIECYLRLSRIAADMGKYDEASQWLARALSVDENEPDVNICLGDLYARNSLWEDAKKCYEKLVSATGKDSRAMLSLGNFYFMNLSDKVGEVYDNNLKNTYKFYHHVLTEDNKNVYAAVGLGMVCAEKGEFDVAREVFSRAREANMPMSEDICTNLANIHMIQGRLIDADHLYQATIKNLAKSSHSTSKSSEKILSLNECMALSQFKHARHEESLRTLCKAIHQDPSSLRSWYNVGVIRGEIAIKIRNKKQKSVSDIQDAFKELELTHKLFSFLSLISSTQVKNQYQKQKAAEKLKMCASNLIIFEDYHKEAIEFENKMNEEKKRIEDDHRAFNLSKQEEKEKIEQAKIDAKKELQVLALAKAQKLKDLREKWGPDMIAEEKKKGGARKKKIAGEDTGGGAEENLDWLDEKGGTKTKSLMDSNPEINFSSDEEQNDDEERETIQPKQNQAELDDLFGKDDSDIGEPNDISSTASYVKRNRNSLESDLFGDSDDDDEDRTFDAKSSSSNTNDSKKMRRSNVIEDDDE